MVARVVGVVEGVVCLGGDFKNWCDGAAMATVGYAASAREEALAAAVFAWATGEDGLVVLLDVPARFDSILTISCGVDAMLPNRNRVGACNVANREYNAHLKTLLKYLTFPPHFK